MSINRLNVASNKSIKWNSFNDDLWAAKEKYGNDSVGFEIEIIE